MKYLLAKCLYRNNCQLRDILYYTLHGIICVIHDFYSLVPNTKQLLPVKFLFLILLYYALHRQLNVKIKTYFSKQNAVRELADDEQMNPKTNIFSSEYLKNVLTKFIYYFPYIL